MTGSGRGSKFVMCRDVQDGYRRRLSSATGVTLGASSQGHLNKNSCYEEMRSFATNYPHADVLDVAVD